MSGRGDPAGWYEPVAVVDRSGWPESVHAGAVVVTSAAGDVVDAIGDPDAVVYPRSSTKPLQACALVEAGFTGPASWLALAAASHSGGPAHLAVVREILAAHGLATIALGNVADLPLGQDEAAEYLRGGGAASALTMNCSGKHAAMLATCVVNGWPIDTYLDPEHPLQRHITDLVGRLTEDDVSEPGTDGCGAPAHRMSLAGLARAVGALASGSAGAAGLAVSSAMTEHPDLVGGAGRDVTQFMQAMPGLLAKDGADGVYVAATADGRGIALKVADGSARARPLLLAAGLVMAGLDPTPASAIWKVAVLGGGRPVGGVRAVGRVAAVLDSLDR